MGFLINQYQGFSGNAVEMASVATQCAQFLQIPGDLDKINERLVRYYVAEGLVGRPKRIGRDAEYDYLHLLQFLAGRFLVDAGFPMQKVAPYLTSLESAQLEALIMNKTKPNMAELLVASFMHGDRTKDQLEDLDPITHIPKVGASKKITKAQENVMSSAKYVSQSARGSLGEVGDLIGDRISDLSQAIKEGLSDIRQAQAGALKSALNDLTNNFSMQLEQIRMEMAQERERWHLHMERQREEQHVMLAQHNLLNQEMIRTLNNAQGKGKENA
jgi:DNA-binding transcriptional MerR regulator